MGESESPGLRPQPRRWHTVHLRQLRLYLSKWTMNRTELKDFIQGISPRACVLHFETFRSGKLVMFSSKVWFLPLVTLLFVNYWVDETFFFGNGKPKGGIKFKIHGLTIPGNFPSIWVLFFVCTLFWTYNCLSFKKWRKNTLLLGILCSISNSWHCSLSNF